MPAASACGRGEVKGGVLGCFRVFFVVILAGFGENGVWDAIAASSCAVAPVRHVCSCLARASAAAVTGGTAAFTASWILPRQRCGRLPPPAAWLLPPPAACLAVRAALLQTLLLAMLVSTCAPSRIQLPAAQTSSTQRSSLLLAVLASTCAARQLLPTAALRTYCWYAEAQLGHQPLASTSACLCRHRLAGPPAGSGSLACAAAQDADAAEALRAACSAMCCGARARKGVLRVCALLARAHARQRSRLGCWADAV